MIAEDRDALTCDLAETYGIFDFRALPVSLLATLCVGLRDDSRIKMKKAGVKLSLRDMLLAAAVDKLTMQNWLMSEDGAKGTNRPSSILTALLGTEADTSGIIAFATADEFEAEWQRRTGVSHGGR